MYLLNLATTSNEETFLEEMVSQYYIHSNVLIFPLSLKNLKSISLLFQMANMKMYFEKESTVQNHSNQSSVVKNAIYSLQKLICQASIEKEVINNLYLTYNPHTASNTGLLKYLDCSKLSRHVSKRYKK